MTRSHNCNLKMCIKGYSFWISRLLGIKQRYSWYPKVFCAWKRGRQKRRYWGKVAKDNSFKSLRMLRYRSWRSSILWRNVLEERREIIRMGFIVFPSVRFGGAFNIFVPFLLSINFKFEAGIKMCYQRRNCLCNRLSTSKWSARQTSRLGKLLKNLTNVTWRKFNSN